MRDYLAHLKHHLAQVLDRSPDRARRWFAASAGEKPNPPPGAGLDIVGGVFP